MNVRCNIAFGLLALAIFALCGRLVWLVRSDPRKAATSALKQQRRYIPQPGKPGSVLARSRGSYVLLAGSKQVPSCYVDPGLIKIAAIPGIALRAGRSLGISPLEVQETILARGDRRFAYLKRQISPAQVEAIRRQRLASVGITYEWRRDYPCGDLAATLLGFCYKDGQPGGGLETSQRPFLAPADGLRVVRADAARRGIWPDPQLSRLPRDGYNVLLCLDAVIQGYLQGAVAEAVAEFDAKWGTGVVADPHTGEILAMCSVPTFHPARFNAVDPACRTERAVSVPYEPGSAMKPIFAAAAVDVGRFSYASRIFCENGVYRASRGGRISDHGKRYGSLSLAEIVIRSSNIGMAKVGEALGNRRLHAVAERFGFGRKTDVELPGESRGQLRPLAKWDGYSMRRVPFGQEISATALQMTMAFCALANGGELLHPRLVEAICGVNGRVLWRGRRQVVRRVLRPRTAAETLKVLQQVVEHEGGTGKACRLDYWTSFGKTGTAQIPGRGGYVDGAYAGTFVGGAPASMPRAVCLITIYWPDKRKGYYGSKVAAPQVKKVLHKTLVYLEVPPDKDDARMARGRRSPRGDLAVRRRSAAGSRGAAAAPAGNAHAAADSF